MTRIGITGGIGSGKSYLCHQIEAQGDPVFYCDDEAKRIIRSHAAVKADLQALVGQGVYDDSGALRKQVLARYLCQGKAAAARVDAIVHPRVAEAWRAYCQAHATHQYIYMECALLFESGFDRWTDYTVLVTAPEPVRVQRIMARDGVTREAAEAWIALQMPEQAKAERADACLINDGRQDLAAEWASLMASLRQQHP
ncbi:MAG: dephospho-CoA kinase [Bacteroidales bacterium]|nr:dephospho-CoA kinase [Candidatus Equimonas enterica]